MKIFFWLRLSLPYALQLWRFIPGHFPLSAILPQLPLPVIPADIPNSPGRGRKGNM